MGHFAKIDGSNLVTQVTIIDDDEIRGNGGEYTTEVETYVGEIIYLYKKMLAELKNYIFDKDHGNVPAHGISNGLQKVASQRT